MSAGRSAVIIGATGQVGAHLLKELLANGAFTTVAEYGRRTTPVEKLPQEHIGKLSQKTVDFEKLNADDWKAQRFDTVFITLGTSRAIAGSAEAFEKIDREYVLNVAKAAKVDGFDQRVVYCSVSWPGIVASTPHLSIFVVLRSHKARTPLQCSSTPSKPTIASCTMRID